MYVHVSCGCTTEAAVTVVISASCLLHFLVLNVESLQMPVCFWWAHKNLMFTVDVSDLENFCF